MAADVLSNVYAGLTQSFSSRLSRTWNRQAIISTIIGQEDEGGQGDAKEVAWDAEFSGATAASFVEGSDAAAAEFNQDPIIPAVLGWGQYRSAVQVSNKEINASLRNQAGPAALLQLVRERVLGAATKLASVINQDIFTGTGSDAFGNPTVVGLAPALNTAATYAGITKASFTEWTSNVLANGGNVRPLSYDLLANLEQLIFVSSGIEPDVIVCSPGVFRKYENLFEVGKRTVVDGLGAQPISAYQGSTSGGVNVARTNTFWRGKPVIRDRNCPAGSLFMLNLGEIFLKPLPFMQISPDGVAVQQMMVPSSNGTMQGGTSPATVPTNFGCAVYPLARTGSAIRFMCEVYLQLKINRPNAHAICVDISET